MKKGICMGCLPGDGPEKKLELAGKAGFDGVEIGATSDEQTVALKAAADRHGLEIPSIMGGEHWSHPLSDPDPQVRKQCRVGIETSLRQARTIGATAVLLVPAVVTEKVTYEQAWNRSIEEVRGIAEVAEREQIYLALENVWNKFLLSPVEFKAYLEQIDSPYVKAYFDCGNIVSYGFPQHWIRGLSSHIVKIHVKGFTVFPNTAFPHSLISDVPWKACRAAWEAIGYDDFLTVEIGADPGDPQGSIHRYAEQLGQIIRGEVDS